MSDALAELADLILNVGREIRSRTPVDADVVPLTETERGVMRYVDLHPGASPSDIARGTGLRRSNVSPALRGLEDKGMVEVAAEGRTRSVTSTELAADNLARLHAAWSARLSAALGDDLADVAACNVLLARLERRLADARGD